MASGALIATAACAAQPPDVQRLPADVDQAELNHPWFGGYLDVTLTPGLRLQDVPVRGRQTTVLSFIGSNPTQPCEPSWGGYYNLMQADDQLNLGIQVDGVRRAGDDVAISFGGQLNKELAVACTDSDALLRAYASVIARYGLNIVDLDVEGMGLEDDAAARRRAAAMARLQAERPAEAPLKVWLTLPVSSDGLTPDGRSAVTTMLEAGVDLAGVNIMTMNFGPLEDGQTMLAAAKSAAAGTHRALAQLYESAGRPLGTAAVWKKIGLTPMVGMNDVKGQVFTLEDAAGLNGFAAERGIGRMSMWSLNRDFGCGPTSGKQLGAPSADCSGIEQEPRMFAQLLGPGFTG